MYLPQIHIRSDFFGTLLNNRTGTRDLMYAGDDIDIFKDDSSSDELYASASEDCLHTGKDGQYDQTAATVLKDWQEKNLDRGNSILLPCYADERFVIEKTTIDECDPNGIMCLTVIMIKYVGADVKFGRVSNFSIQWTLKEFQDNVSILQGVHEAIPQKLFNQAYYLGEFQKEAYEAESKGCDVHDKYKQMCGSALEIAINTHGSHIALRTLAENQKLEVFMLKALPYKPDNGWPTASMCFRRTDKQEKKQYVRGVPLCL